VASSVQLARSALRARVDELLRGSGLEVRELADQLVISDPRHPDSGRIYIRYASGDVSYRRVIWDYFGSLDGYELRDQPDHEPGVDAAKIIGTLAGQRADR
jgi:hypothetical protein